MDNKSMLAVYAGLVNMIIKLVETVCYNQAREEGWTVDFTHVACIPFQDGMYYGYAYENYPCDGEPDGVILCAVTEPGTDKKPAIVQVPAKFVDGLNLFFENITVKTEPNKLHAAIGAWYTANSSRGDEPRDWHAEGWGHTSFTENHDDDDSWDQIVDVSHPHYATWKDVCEYLDAQGFASEGTRCQHEHDCCGHWYHGAARRVKYSTLATRVCFCYRQNI